MALSKVTIDIQEGNLGLPTSGAQNCVRFGVCTTGVPGQLYAFSSQSNVISSLGVGAGSERVGFGLTASGGPVLFVPVDPNVSGSGAQPTHSGTGTATITVTTAPCKQITLLYTSTGGPDVGKYKVQLGSDAYGPVETIPGNADGYSVRIPGTYTTLTFAGAGTYNSGDGYIFNTSGGATEYGASSGVSADSDPVDDFNATVTVSKAGAVGTAKAVVSLDGYGQVGGAFVLSTAYAIPMPNGIPYTTGVVLNNAGTFVANDTYSFQTCGPTSTNSDFTTAASSLVTSTKFSLLHFDNKHATAALADAFASAVTTVTSTLFGEYSTYWFKSTP